MGHRFPAGERASLRTEVVGVGKPTLGPPHRRGQLAVTMAMLIAGGSARADGDVNPTTEWKPVLESRAAVEIIAFGDTPTVPAQGTGVTDSESSESQVFAHGFFDVAARVGAQVQRRALTARVTVAADGYWYTHYDEALEEVYTGWATVPYLSEAWVDLDPKISESLETSFRVGRQPLQFHEGRIIGRDDRTLRGDFPDAARALLRGDPLQVEVIAGADVDVGTESDVQATEQDSEPREVFSVTATPLVLVRAGVTRENPATHWVADAIFTTAWTESGERRIDTVGAYAKADVGRIRSRVDLYVQPYELAPAWLGGARLGWAIGDDARVVLGVLGEARSAEGGGTLGFTRPWRSTGEDFGQLDLYEPDDVFGLDGVADTAVYAEAKVVPSLRIDSQAHVLSGLETDARQAEIDADVHWWFTPHAHLRVRSAVNIPLANPDEVRSLTSISLDLAI